MSVEIHKARIRAALRPRPEPYWAAPIAPGKYLGFRKIDAQRGAWIARARSEGGRQAYKALGALTEAFDFDRAREAAGGWFKQQDRGIVSDHTTVEIACKEYVEDRRSERGEATAHDADMRFKRTVYGRPFGAIPLVKVRTARIKQWRDELGLGKATANRTLISLKAALNLAVAHRLVSADLAFEWAAVKPHKHADGRRELYLDVKQRRALLAAAKGNVRHLIHAAMLTGARAGELTGATCSQFDAKTKSMTFTGKTGPRRVPVSPAALALFKKLAKGRLPADRLLVRDDGKPWAHSDWDELVRNAAAAAALPAGVCLYSLRHAFITTALTSGMSTLDVGRLVGTSVSMIERHYGHLVHDAAAQRLAKVKIL